MWEGSCRRERWLKSCLEVLALILTVWGCWGHEGKISGWASFFPLARCTCWETAFPFCKLEPPERTQSTAQVEEPCHRLYFTPLTFWRTEGAPEKLNGWNSDYWVVTQVACKEETILISARHLFFLEQERRWMYGTALQGHWLGLESLLYHLGAEISLGMKSSLPVHHFSQAKTYIRTSIYPWLEADLIICWYSFVGHCCYLQCSWAVWSWMNSGASLSFSPVTIKQIWDLLLSKFLSSGYSLQYVKALITVPGTE